MKSSFLSRRESIILSAIDIIDELGIHNLSTREIAKRQNVTDASLYRHFKSKDDIVLAILDYSSQFDLTIMKTVENNKLKPKEGILFFIKSFAEYYENYPAITAILHSYEILGHDEHTANKVKDIFTRRSSFIDALVREGQATKEICSQFDAEDLSDIIMGTLFRLTLKWRMNQYNFSLKKRTLTSIETLLNIC
ncbi:MAG: TetR/AcrR family transcriptional regulator [Clostridia bacterium]|nr:TetR/AcrR family transcriptional regulator [Clostridia bacterium]